MRKNEENPIRIIVDFLVEEADFQQTAGKYAILQYMRTNNDEDRHKAESHQKALEILVNIMEKINEYSDIARTTNK